MSSRQSQSALQQLLMYFGTNSTMASYLETINDSINFRQSTPLTLKFG